MLAKVARKLFDPNAEILRLALECFARPDAAIVLGDLVLQQNWFSQSAMRLLRHHSDWSSRHCDYLYGSPPRTQDWKLSNEELHFRFAAGQYPEDISKHEMFDKYRRLWGKAVAADLMFRHFQPYPWQ